MKKTPIYLHTDLEYLVTTYNLLMNPQVMHLKKKSAKGRLAFTIKDDPIFTDVLIQVTSRGKLNIYPPEDAPKEEIIEKTLRLLSDANQAPIKILRKKRAILNKQKQYPAPRVDYRITQHIRNHPLLRRKLPDVGFNIHNLNDYPVRVKVETRTILGGRNLGLKKDKKGYYSGETPWNVNPGKIAFGHFNVPKECLDSNEELTIEIRATMIDPNDKEYIQLPVSWTYVRKRNEWYFEPTAFTNDK